MKRKNSFAIRDICEIAMLCALAIVLGLFCEIKVGENGGSIGFSMLPLLFICYRHGFIKGFLASGFVYGIVTCAVDGYGFFCYPFDYLLAYGSLSVVSFFYRPIFESEKRVQPYLYIVLSVFIACFLRFAFHVISGMLLWETPFWGSVTYNFIYVAPSCLLCIALFCILYLPFKKINRMFPVAQRV